MAGKWSKLWVAILRDDTDAMLRAYSDELRCKNLQAYERAAVEQLADQFGVSYGFTKKIRR